MIDSFQNPISETSQQLPTCMVGWSLFRGNNNISPDDLKNKKQIRTRYTKKPNSKDKCKKFMFPSTFDSTYRHIAFTSLKFKHS